MIKEFSYTFNQLGILQEDLHALLGFKVGEIPEPFPQIINKAMDDAPQLCNISGGYKIFNQIEIDRKQESITIDNQTFYPTKIVTTQLKDSEAVALFICTAGSEISIHSAKISDLGDPMLGYIFDVIGSVMVDKAMDKIQEELEKEMSKKGLHISDRYSPGYCDWSVAEQQYLFQLMPENFCGVSLSDSSLMNPIKSISGIIGIGKNQKQKGYQCHWCTDTNCIYGKIKREKKSL